MKLFRDPDFYWFLAIAIFIFVLFPGCATVKVPNFKAHVTLPASGDGYYVTTVTGEEGRVPKEKWEEQRKRGIIILKEDWSILRNTVLENCLANECKDAVGTFDGLFEAIDTGLNKIPKKKK